MWLVLNTDLRDSVRSDLALDEHFEEWFAQPSPDAPNVWIAAGLYRKGSAASAAGFSRNHALAGMFGELCEIRALADFETPQPGMDIPTVALHHPAVTSASQHFVPATDIATDQACRLPLDCLRPDPSSSVKTSEGCGAAASLEDAILHGLLELPL